MSGLLGYLVLFVLVGVGFVFVHLMIGKMIRPSRPDADKLTIYECGEPTIGSAWVQFDLRFYVVALLFVIFDVEVAFFFPWAVVFGQAVAVAKPDGATPGQAQLADRELLQNTGNQRLTPDQQIAQAAAQKAAAGQYAWLAFFDILVFFGVLLVGFAYLWSRGDLKWVRSLAAEEKGPAPPVPANGVAAPAGRVLAGAGS
jgi:NADH-quinone oxidoreductase subunit A